MNETTAQMINGILVVKTKTSDATKTIRYIDSSRGLILDTLEEYDDKTILTKYKSNGLQPKTVEVTTFNKKMLYQGDGKTLISIHEKNEETIISTHFCPDGKTVEKVKTQYPIDITETFYFQPDGRTLLKRIDTDALGMTKTSIYDEKGKSIISTQEDMADGSILKTFFRADGTIEKKCQSHIKGLAKGTIRQTLFDATGQKKLAVEDILES